MFRLSLLPLTLIFVYAANNPACAQTFAPSALILWGEVERTATSDAASTQPTTASSSPATPSPFTGSWATRTKVTSNWGGYRDELAAQGITFDASMTQFYQGINTGGREQGYFYGGRFDMYLNIDGEKAGLAKGSFINLHGESIYGQSANNAAGTISPVSLGQLFPNASDNDVALTGIKYTQFLSKTFALFGGKINTLDGFNQPFAGGRGVDAFMNTSLGIPLVALRTVPYSAWGGGFIVLDDKAEPIFSVMALDTQDSTRSTGFENFFGNGVTLIAQATLPVKFNDLPGHHGLGATYSTGEYRSLDRTSYYDPNEGQFIPSPLVRGSWSLFYMFDQALFVDPCNAKRTWGIFGNAGIADTDPSPIRWIGNIGFGGSSPLVSRPYDNFGVGYFYNGLGDNVKSLAPNLLQLGDEHGVELFYNVGVTPWCHITPDFQVVLPGHDRFEAAVLFGLRMKIDF